MPSSGWILVALCYHATAGLALVHSYKCGPGSPTSLSNCWASFCVPCGPMQFWGWVLYGSMQMCGKVPCGHMRLWSWVPCRAKLPWGTVPHESMQWCGWLTYGAMHCGAWVPCGVLVGLRKCGAHSLVDLCDCGVGSPVHISNSCMRSRWSNANVGRLVELCICATNLVVAVSVRTNAVCGTPC